MADRYRQSPDELYYEFSSAATGLTKEQAEKNIEKYGVNELTQAKKKTPLQIFLSQFADFIVIILIIAAAVSMFMGDKESFWVILVVITMNAILGTVQTLKAEKSLDNLKQLNAPNAKVLRSGEGVIIPSNEVAVGDIVLLEAGDSIPADGRLIESASLLTNESALTGESLNIDQDIDTIDR
ncbi:MAG: HAD-IC family P-type ATPase, partial [Ruminococcus sp.]|nr:HAD-IC family P-type ATPase [Ruminococcus sp.]